MTFSLLLSVFLDSSGKLTFFHVLCKSGHEFHLLSSFNCYCNNQKKQKPIYSVTLYQKD